MTAPSAEPPARAIPADCGWRRQTLLDAVKRGAGGTFLFLPLWLSVGWSCGIHLSWPRLFWFNAAAFLVYGLTRFKLTQAAPAVTTANLPRAETMFCAVLMLNALHWGVLTAASTAWAPLHEARMPMYLTSVGLAGAGTINLAILRPLRAYPMCVLGPPLLLLLVLPLANRPLQVFEIVALVLYIGYVRHVSMISHDDYHRAASARAELEQRARELERLSTTDALTGIANRHLFDDRLAADWARAAREGAAVSLLMIDVDHFKRINDGFGHAVGDRCLVAVAQAMSASLARGADLLARYGGEEFAVLLPGASMETARLVGERLRRSVEAIVLDHEGVPIRIAVSVGVSSGSARSGTSPHRALQQADDALYTAKREGRNRVVIAQAMAA